MAFKITHTVGCDYAGCKAEASVKAVDKAQAMQLLTQQGWAFYSTEEGYCPKHAEDGHVTMRGNW